MVKRLKELGEQELTLVVIEHNMLALMNLATRIVAFELWKEDSRGNTRRDKGERRGYKMPI